MDAPPPLTWVPRAAGLLAAVSLLLTAACSRDGFEDRTAVVDLGEETVRFTVDTCGLDESTVFVVGRSSGGEVLQAVIGLTDDPATGSPESTGLTFDVDDQTYAAFGADSWELRTGSGAVPGRISWARLRGARIQAAGEAVPLDDQDRVSAGAEPRPFELDARCDERDEA